MTSNVWTTAVFVLSTAAANILQKKGMSAIGPVRGISGDTILRAAANPYIWGGMLAYALALAAYLILLSRVPLNVATSIAALNFIAVILASRFVLGEPIPALRYLGFALILLGVYVVAQTQQAAGQ